MKVYISSDHAGFKLKEYLVGQLDSRPPYQVEDWGPERYDANDDYPKTTLDVVKHIAENPKARGILICKNGVGVTIFANRFKSVRAGLSWSEHHAKSHRIDDNTNILTLPAGYITPEEAVEIALAWLETPASDEPRHERRQNQIEKLSP